MLVLDEPVSIDRSATFSEITGHPTSPLQVLAPAIGMTETLPSLVTLSEPTPPVSQLPTVAPTIETATTVAPVLTKLASEPQGPATGVASESQQADPALESASQGLDSEVDMTPFELAQHALVLDLSASAPPTDP